MPLPFTADGEAISATAPANANVAPPGVYMLFVVGADGVPSVAKMVQVGDDGEPPPNQAPSASITAPLEGASFPRYADITIEAAASDSDGSIQRVQFFRGTNAGVKLGADKTAPYSFTWTGVESGNRTLTVKATDNAGAVTTSAPVHVTVQAQP